MAKFKKLAMLCAAVMMTASVATLVACGDDKKTDSSTPDSSVSSSVEEGSSSVDETSSEDEISSSEEPTSSDETESSDVIPDDSSSEDTTSSEDEVSSSEEPTSSDETESSDVIPDDSSSEDDSSEDGSSEVPPVVEEDYYVNIVDGEASSITTIGNYEDAFSTVTFQAPSAGTYAIYAVNAAFEEAGITFGPQGSTNEEDFFVRYTFDVAAAGDVTIATCYESWEAETLAFNYYVYKINSVAAETTGSAELATCARNAITFNLPEAGLYLINANTEVTWYSNRSLGEGDATTASFYSFTADQAGEYTVYVESVNYGYESFNFEYELIHISTVTLTEGETTATAYKQVYVPVNFTAEVAGTYTLTVSSADNYTVYAGVAEYVNEDGGYWTWVEGDYESTFIFSVEAGETKNMHIYATGYDADYNSAPTCFEIAINITGFEEADPSNLQIGENTFTATADGVSASFTAPETGWYNIYDAVGDSIFLEGSEEGTDVYEVNLEAGATVSFTVKGDGIVTLEISKFTPPVTLNVGENTISIPSEGAELQWGDLAYYTPYALTISNENVVVYINGTPYTSGTPFEISGWSSYSIATIDGTEAENVVITITKFEYPTLILGDNADLAVSASGTTYQYTVDSIDPGCYAFTITGNVTNVTLSADNAINYPDALSAAGTISIHVQAGTVIELYMEAEADTTVSVNVACTSTVNSLEASVTMNTDGTIPESLTISSLKYGECAYYVANRMVGDYNITWNAENYNNIIVYAGENVGMSYDPQVRLTRTMMDGNVYLIVYNNCLDEDGNGIDLTNVVLNFAVYEEPAAEPQGQLVKLNEKTTIEIEAWGSTLFSFIAPADGTYTLKTESSVLVDLWVVGNWGYDRAWANVIDSTTGGEYTFELAEGEIINFFAMEYDMGAVSFVFTISEKIEDVPGDDSSSEIPNDSSSEDIPGDDSSSEIPNDSSSEDIPGDSSSEDSSSSSEDSSSEESETVTVQFTDGTATYVEIPANGTTIMEGYIVGDYTVEWDPSITNLVVYCGMQPVANGDIITATSPMMPTQLTLTTSDGAALATRIMVSKYVAPPVELVVGNNAVATNNQGKTATFTATEDGDYTLSAAEGETNAWIMIGDEYGSEAIELPYSFTLKAGATASFIVLTNDFTEDTIDLVITIVPTADELNFTIATKENPATNDFELIANSYGVGKITLKGEYTFTWQATYKKEGEETPKEVPVVVTINGEAITSGTKIKYDTETEVEIVITPVDMTTGCKISFVITEVPEVVKPNEEWTKNY